MPRNGRAPIAAAAVISVFALVGCGGEETASNNGPSVTSSTSKPATSTTSAEAMQSLPPGFPGPPAEPMDDKGKAFLAELKKKKVPYSDQGDSAISIARTICQGQRENIPADLIRINTLAMVGTELSLVGSSDDPQQVTNIYLDTAKAKFC